jgi:hypothetical protein
MLIKLELTIEETNLLLAGLEELPVKKSINLINKIVKEAQDQTKPKEEIKEETQERFKDI